MPCQIKAMRKECPADFPVGGGSQSRWEKPTANWKVCWTFIAIGVLFFSAVQRSASRRVIADNESWRTLVSSSSPYDYFLYLLMSSWRPLSEPSCKNL